MSDVPTHILLVEDNPGDVVLLRELLAETNHGRFRLTHVDRLAAGISCAQKGSIDLVLLDLSLPDSHGFETLDRMHAESAGIPIVVMTGIEDEALGLQLIQRGAQDYLLKGQVTGPLLQRSLRYAIERARMANELRDKQTLLQSVLDSVADGVVMADETGEFKVWNPAASRIVGSGSAPLQIDEWTSHYGLFLPDMTTPYPPRALPLARAIQGKSTNDELIFIRSDKHHHEAWLSVNARPLRDETGRVKGGVAVFRDISQHRATEDALRKTQEQYRLLVTKANDIIYRTDAMGRFTFVNPVAARIMKYTEEELLGRRFVELIHPDYREAAERFYGRQFVRRLPSTYYEFLAQTKDGTDVWIGQNVQVLQDEGEVIGFQAVARDFTERKLVQAALSASEERFRSLVSNLPGAVYRCAYDPDWTMEFLSDPIEQLCGYPASDFIANRVRSYASVIHPDDRETVERVVLSAVAQRQAFATEYRVLHKDGDIRWMYEKGQGVFAGDGRVLWLDGAIFDITERKRAEEALTESEERFRSIVQSTDKAIIVMDTDGQAVFWNRGAEKCFGYTAEEMVGQPIARIVPERFRDAHQRGVQRVATTGGLTVHATMFELVGLRKDGTEFPLEFSLAAWTAKSKLYITAIIRDITERKAAESALLESEGRYRQLIESLPAAVYTCDREGRITLYNQAAVALWGRAPERGKDLWCGSWRIYRPDGAPLSGDQCPMAVAMREGRPVRDVEIVIERPDGTRRHVLPNPEPIYDASGVINGFVNMLIDITERKQAEEERQKLARDRVLLLESTGDGIYGIDLEGRCTFINKAGAQMLGHRPDEVMGKDMHQLIHHSLPDGAAYPRVECRIYGAFKNQQSCHIDHEVFWRKDGTSFPVSYSSFPVVEQETITGAVVTFVDITERQRLEDERSRRAARLVKQQTALTALTQSRLFQTSELMSTLRHISAIAARTLGIERVSIWRFTGDRGSLQCIDLFELSHGRHSAGMSLSAASSPIYFAALASSPIIAADDVHTDERTRELSNSFLSPASINSMMDVPVYLFGRLEGAICHEHVGPIRHWSEDEQMFAVAMSNLVTLAYEQGERRWAEEQLRQSQEQLRNLTGRLESIQEEERIRISREVHDELGQELTGVKLELAFLRDQLVQSCPALLSRIEAITKQVDGTMQSVRKIATALRPVVLDQLGLLPAIEWQAGDFQAKTGITCTLNFYLRAVALPIERSTGVFRIFQEILTNVARHAGASHVDISVQEHKGHLLLSVIDNGRGITEEEVSGSKSLGLLGMRERALLLGGETKIERNPDRGTTVKLRIPMDPPTPDPADGDGEPFGQV